MTHTSIVSIGYIQICEILSIKLHFPNRYPCISNRAEYHETKTHSGSIGCVRFLYGDRSLISIGGTDASLMIWELSEGSSNSQNFTFKLTC